MSATKAVLKTTPLVAALVFALGGTPAAAAPIDDYNLAVKFFQQKRWTLVAELTQSFLNAEPDHPKAPLARLYLGQSLAQEKKYEEARAVFREFLTKHPGHKESALATYRVGESSYFLGDTAAAISELSTFADTFREDSLVPWARLYLGECFVSQSKWQQALTQFEAVLAKPPTDTLKADAAYGAARSLDGLGRRNDALKAYEPIAGSRSRRAPDALFAIGTLYYELGQFPEAQAAFDSFETQYPAHPLFPRAQLNSGYAAYRSGDLAAARKRFENALDESAQGVVARYWLGLTEHAEQRFAEAIPQFRQVATSPAVPNELIPKSLFYAADCELRLQKFAAALASFRDILDRFPNESVADNAAHEATEAASRIGDFAAVREFAALFETRFAQSPLRPRQQLLVAQAAIERVTEDPTDSEAVGLAEKMLGLLIAAGGELEMRARLENGRLLSTLERTDEAITVLGPLLAASLSDSTIEPKIANDARLLGASLLLDADRPSEAEKLAAAVLGATDGKNAAAARFLARARAELENWDGVEAAIAGIEPSPERTSLLIDVAESAFEKMAWENAAAWFAAAAEDENAPASALSGLGYSRYELSQFTAAAAAFALLEQRAVGNPPLASTAAWMRGLSLQQAGETNEAQRVFEAGVATFTQDPGQDDFEGDIAGVARQTYQMAKQAARIARDNSEVARADRYYDIAAAHLARLPSERPLALDKLINEWALLAYENENFERSDELFQRLLDQTPNSPFADDAQLYLAESAFFSGQVDEARSAFRKLSTSESSDAFVAERSSLLLLDIAAESADWKDLLLQTRSFQKRFTESTSLTYAMFREGEALLRLEDYVAAVDVLQKARARLDQTGGSGEAWVPSIWVFLTEAAVRVKNYDAVEAAAAEFASRFPNSPYQYQIDEILGRAWKNRAEFPKARDAFSRVIDSEAGRRTITAAKSQLLIAETYLLERNFEDALKAYYMVYVNYAFPEFQAPALLKAGECDEQLQQWSKAAATYQTLIEEFPTSEFATDAAQRLAAVKARIE